MEIQGSNFLSGSTGYTILNNDNKKILLFADIHDGVQYCKSTNSIDIDKLLDAKSNTHQVLLEEAFNNSGLNLTGLWNAKHTNKLRELKENNSNVIPTDIRPYLIPFSWQFAKSNKKYKECKIETYLYLLDEFFNKSGKVYEKIISPYFSYIKNKDDITKIIYFFELIKKKYKVISYKYTKRTIGYILDIDKEYLHSIDNINSYIMEYYILILLLSDKRNTIIHTGLAHSSRLKEVLIKIFKFEIKQDHELTNIENYTGSDNTHACIFNPKISTTFFDN